MTVLELVTLAVCALVAAPYLLMPLLIRFAYRQAAVSRFRVLQREAVRSMNPDLWRFFADHAVALEPLGFECVDVVEVIGPLDPKMRLALFRHREGRLLAVATGAANPTGKGPLAAERFAFGTVLEDATLLQTVAEPEAQPPRFPRAEEQERAAAGRLFPFHGSFDLADLLDAHRRLVEHHRGERAVRSLAAAEVAPVIERAIQKDEAESCPRGWFVVDEAENLMRPTMLGAIAMTYRQLFPLKGIRMRRAARDAARRTERNLAAIGRAAPRGAARADAPRPRFPEGHPLARGDDDEAPGAGASGEDAAVAAMQARYDAIADHVARFVGEPSDRVFADVVPGAVRVGVHFVPPAPDRPYWYLFTTGMSERPLPGSNGVARYSELAIALPPRWPIGEPAMNEPRHFWPIYWLRALARLPHERNVALVPGHTIPNGDPAEPYFEDSELCCMLVATPQLGGEGFGRLTAPDGGELCILALTPLTRAEMERKLAEDDPVGFLRRTAAAGLTELVDPDRESLPG